MKNLVCERKVDTREDLIVRVLYAATRINGHTSSCYTSCCETRAARMCMSMKAGILYIYSRSESQPFSKCRVYKIT
jgi:hypothetical protein